MRCQAEGARAGQERILLVIAERTLHVCGDGRPLDGGEGVSMQTTRWPDFRTGTEWRTRNRLRRDEIRRTWAQWLARIRWDAFVTLTFDPQRLSVNRLRASRETFNWCNDTARVLRCPIGWIYAVERGTAGGQWHSHALIVGTTAELLRGVPASQWAMRNGYVNVKPVFDVGGVTLYTTKSAAVTGELVWSDTLAGFRERVGETGTLLLHPE